MTPPSLEHLRAAAAFHKQEHERYERMLKEHGDHEGASLYHEAQRRRSERLRTLGRGLLFLLLAFAPIVRDLLRAWARWMGWHL